AGGIQIAVALTAACRTPVANLGIRTRPPEGEADIHSPKTRSVSPAAPLSYRSQYPRRQARSSRARPPHNEETFEVTLSDYETPIRTIAGGLAMIGLAQALRLLLEINRRP